MRPIRRGSKNKTTKKGGRFNEKSDKDKLHEMRQGVQAGFHEFIGPVQELSQA